MKIELQIGKYILSFKDEKTFWMTGLDGEGMECDQQKLYDLLDKFYKDNL